MKMIGKRMTKTILVIINIALILIAVLSSFTYSKAVQENQKQAQIDAFCSTIESMKQISINYLKMEERFAKNWANYISSQHFNMDEALDYIRSTNTQENRYAHIVDMDSYEAYSSYKENTKVHCYEFLKEESNDFDRIFIKNMQHMFNDDYDDVSILGKFRADDTQILSIAVGTRVTIQIDESTSKDYLLVRLLPVESMKEIWVFPVDYQSVEVGIIMANGNYVIQSNAMKSSSFTDFIRYYNFFDDYNKVDELSETLLTTQSGLLQYQNSKGQDAYWYYSRFNNFSDLCILGYVPIKSFAVPLYAWNIVLIISSILVLLMMIDGLYILHINRELRKNIELATKASEAKTNFLSSMSHDIRTPMNAIIGMTNIAKKNIHNETYLMQCLDKVSVASTHLLTLINDILDISKIERGKMTLNPATFPLEELVYRLDSIIMPQVEARNIHYQVSLHDLTYPYLIGDELRLNQIYMNLLTNAIKYTPTHGNIQFEIYEQTSMQEGYVTLVCQISDTGIGMSETFQKQMYDSFVRADDSRIDTIQGSGLGLSIVKQMIDLMDGTIECHSVLQQGTTFIVKIDLPIAKIEEDQNLSKVGISILSSNFKLQKNQSDFLDELQLTYGVYPTVEQLKQDDRFNQETKIVFIDTNDPIDWTLLEGISAYFIALTDEPFPLEKTNYITTLQPNFNKETLLKTIRLCFYQNEQDAKINYTYLKDKVILVAEDNDLNYEIIEEMLKGLDITCLRAKDGKECLNILNEKPEGYFDLIFMDIQMPVLNGREATKKIRASKLDYLRHIPIYAMTADAFAEDIQACLDAGMNGHIAKPIHVKDVMKALKQIER